MQTGTKYTIALSVFFVLVIIAIILIIVLGEENEETEQRMRQPEDIDLVLIDRGRHRVTFQLEQIEKFMPWSRSIIVVKMVGQVTYNNPIAEKQIQKHSNIPIIYVQSKHNYGDLEAVVMSLPRLYNNISNDILFLGDTTMPIRPIKKRSLWSPTHKRRMFNYIQPDATMIHLDHFYETTLPMSLINLPDLIETGNLAHYILTIALSNNVVYSPDRNHSIVLMDNEYSDTMQLRRKHTKTQYFVTLFITPSLTQTIQEKLNEKLLCYINKMV